MPNSTIKVVIRQSEKVVLEEEVFAVSSTNEKGPFDILPEHANFICLCKEYITLHKLNGEKQQISISSGLLRVFQNNVKVYLGIVSSGESASQTLQ
jgi:F0F1-type ATP synthase epsilon subunit